MRQRDVASPARLRAEPTPATSSAEPTPAMPSERRAASELRVDRAPPTSSCVRRSSDTQSLCLRDVAHNMTCLGGWARPVRGRASCSGGPEPRRTQRAALASGAVGDPTRAARPRHCRRRPRAAPASPPQVRGRPPRDRRGSRRHARTRISMPPRQQLRLTGVARARDGNPHGAVPPPGLARMGVGGAPVSWLACAHTTPRQQAHGY